MLRSPVHLLPVMARAIHFVLRQGSEILDLAVPLAMANSVGLVYRRPERGKGSHQAFVAAGFFAARSLPEPDRSFAVGPSDSLTGLVTADLVIAFDLSAAAGPGLVAAVGSLVVALFLFVAGSVGSVVAVCPVYLVCSVCFGRSFAAATGKERADLVSCFLVLRFSFLRNRNSLSPLYFGGRASEFVHNDREHLSSR